MREIHYRIGIPIALLIQSLDRFVPLISLYRSEFIRLIVIQVFDPVPSLNLSI